MRFEQGDLIVFDRITMVFSISHTYHGRTTAHESWMLCVNNPHISHSEIEMTYERNVAMIYGKDGTVITPHGRVCFVKPDAWKCARIVSKREQ